LFSTITAFPQVRRDHRPVLKGGGWDMREILGRR
jgi:hypothetical protein